MEFQFILLGLLITIAFYQDIKKGKIPNYLTYSATIVGLFYYLIIDRFTGLFFSTAGAFVGFSVFLLLYLVGAVGAGDVKLFTAIGSLTGIEFVLYCSMYSIIYAGIIGIIIIIVRKEFLVRISNIFRYFVNLIIFRQAESIRTFKNKESLTYPFMYAVLPAVITTWYQFI